MSELDKGSHSAEVVPHSPQEVRRLAHVGPLPWWITGPASTSYATAMLLLHAQQSLSALLAFLAFVVCIVIAVRGDRYPKYQSSKLEIGQVKQEFQRQFRRATLRSLAPIPASMLLSFPLLSQVPSVATSVFAFLAMSAALAYSLNRATIIPARLGLKRTQEIMASSDLEDVTAKRLELVEDPIHQRLLYGLASLGAVDDMQIQVCSLLRGINPKDSSHPAFIDDEVASHALSALKSEGLATIFSMMDPREPGKWYASVTSAGLKVLRASQNR